MATSKRFHKFWFLVLENPGFGRDFLVLVYHQAIFFAFDVENMLNSSYFCTI